MKFQMTSNEIYMNPNNWCYNFRGNNLILIFLKIVHAQLGRIFRPSCDPYYIDLHFHYVNVIPSFGMDFLHNELPLCSGHMFAVAGSTA